ncbi:MAG: TlpA family protein disulfide reductase [Acidobacteria bacterium]|nr:TlpA family protein disulfide reductase [Acidobacteriota bacterium]
MRKKLVPLLGAVAAGAFMMLLFKPEPAASVPVAMEKRQPFADFQMNGLDGRPWRLSDYRGKVVLVNFWATWCPPCRMETPGLVRVARDFQGKGLEVAGISMDSGSPEVRQFVAQYRIPYAILRPSADDPLASRIESLPTTFLLDRQGRVAKTYSGAEDESVFRADVTRLLAEQ